MLNLFKSRETKLLEAKKKLESDLENGDLVFLIQQMGSKDIYSSLLNKKRKTETSNNDHVSWYAYRRAEQLKSESDKSKLLKLLDDEAFKSHKRHIYFALGHLCKNRKDVGLFNLLMDMLTKEKKTDYLTSLLIGIGGMDKSDPELNIEPLKRLAKVRSKEVKIRAIIALQKTNDAAVEPLLLELFTSTKDSHMKGMICTPLETVGSEKSIPILQAAYKRTRDPSLRWYTEDTIAEIKKRVG